MRIPENSQLSYKIVPAAKIQGCLTRDLGQGGMRFYTHEFIPKGSTVEVRVNLKKLSFSFQTFVKVMWSRKEVRGERYEVGAEFVSLPRQSTEHLIRYIKSILKIA